MKYPQPALDAAERLLGFSSKTSEASIQSALEQILHTMQKPGFAEIEMESSVKSGRTDIYIPRLRCVVEMKRVAKAKASVLDQLQPYIHDLIESELQPSLVVSEAERNRPWTGITTDGKIWHIWKFDHRSQSLSRPVGEPVSVRKPEEILDLIHRILPEDPIGKPYAPKNISNLFKGEYDELRTIYEDCSEDRETATKFRLWCDMMEASGMIPDGKVQQNKLFVIHSFLVAFARTVIHAVEKDSQDDQKEDAKSILRSGFVSWIFRNPKGNNWQKRNFEKISSYDWRRQTGDILRKLYEDFVDLEGRKMFGEHYTPDWLAEILARNTLTEDWMRKNLQQSYERKNLRPGEPLRGAGVLDPCCGSSSILYQATRRIAKFASKEYPDLQPVEIADMVAALIHGMDIHPVAVEISRANIIRALPAIPSAGANSLQIFQGDSLMIFRDRNQIKFTLSHENTKRSDFLPDDTADHITITFPEAIYHDLPQKSEILPPPPPNPSRSPFPSANTPIPPEISSIWWRKPTRTGNWIPEFWHWFPRRIRLCWKNAGKTFLY